MSEKSNLSAVDIIKRSGTKEKKQKKFYDDQFFRLASVLLIVPVWIFNKMIEGNLLAFIIEWIFACLSVGGMITMNQLKFSGRAKDGDQKYIRGAFFADGPQYLSVLKERFPEKPPMATLGGVSMPPDVEHLHTLISAGTGAGKSVALRGLLASIREKGDRAIVLDNSSEFLAKFREDGDVLLSVSSPESDGWTLANEIRNPFDWSRMAETFIPLGSGSSAEWQQMARAMFAAVGQNASELSDGPLTNREFLRLLTSADMEELAPLLDGTAAAVLVGKDERAESRLQSVRLSFISSLQPLASIRDGSFSFRDWAKRDDSRWLFLPYSDFELGQAKAALATWIDTLVMGALEGTAPASRTTWIIIDELDSLGAIPALLMGATRLRKKRFSIVAALQDYAQLRATYGHDRAQTLQNNLSNKYIMRTTDPEAADTLSRALGEQEFVETSVSYSVGAQGGGSDTVSRNRKTERLVMPAEIQNLAAGKGFIKWAGDWPVLEVHAPMA